MKFDCGFLLAGRLPGRGCPLVSSTKSQSVSGARPARFLLTSCKYRCIKQLKYFKQGLSMKKRFRKRLIVFSSIIALFVLTALFLLIYILPLRRTVVNDLSDYESRKTGTYGFPVVQGMLPALDELPEYVNIDYQYRRVRYFIFTSQTIRLVVTYDDETYEQEKAKTDEKDFLNHALKRSADANNYLIPEHEFFIGSFYFRVLDNMYYDIGNSYGLGYPKQIGIIATSDETNSVAYLYYYNFDRDSVGGSMEDFVKKWFRYNWG
jgi:hypothetical protein